MQKQHLIDLIIKKLNNNRIVLMQAAKTAHAAAINDENIPDNKYDTLSLEASYVAQGQANRAREIKIALEAYNNLEVESFGDDEPIRLTALVLLKDDNGGRKSVFIGPRAGGLTVDDNGEQTTVITPSSPLGKGLQGKHIGDLLDIRIGNTEKEFEIIQVC